MVPATRPRTRPPMIECRSYHQAQKNVRVFLRLPLTRGWARRRFAVEFAVVDHRGEYVSEGCSEDLAVGRSARRERRKEELTGLVRVNDMRSRRVVPPIIAGDEHGRGCEMALSTHVRPSNGGYRLIPQWSTMWQRRARCE
jgi:hypothetical protein